MLIYFFIKVAKLRKYWAVSLNYEEKFLAMVIIGTFRLIVEKARLLYLVEQLGVADHIKHIFQMLFFRCKNNDFLRKNLVFFKNVVYLHCSLRRFRPANILEQHFEI